MDLLRHWRRRTFGAAAGALVAPVAIVAAALTVGIGGGGLNALGSIGQAVSGPDLPPVMPARTRGTAAEAGSLLASVRPRPARPRTQPSLLRADAPAPRAPSAIRRSVPTAAGGPVATAPPPLRASVTRPAAGAAPQTPARPSAPVATSTVAPTASVVEQLGNGVKGVTDQVPVVGKPVGQVVDQLVNTVDALVPPRP